MMTRTAQLENGVFLLVFIVCLFPFGKADTTLILTSQPPSSGPYCPGPVNFTCVGTEVTSTLFWLVNGSRVAVYGHSSRDDLPVDLVFISPLDGVTAVVTEADPTTNNLFNITSIFSVSNVAVLNGSSLQCEYSNNASQPLMISLRLMDIPPPVSCLLHSPGSSEISLQWSPSFTSQYAVERYRVSVNPDPSSCSSDQVSPSEDYSCSGLVLGTRYTFTVSAINCGDQEGEEESFSVEITMKALASPTIVAVTREDNQLIVKWQKVLFPLETNKTFNNAANYSVVIRDIEGHELYQTEVNSSVCDDDGVCTVRNMPADFPLERITVTVTASNVFGESEISVTCVRLTTSNQVLLSLGVFFSAIASLGCVILIVLIVKKGYSMWVLILVIVGCVLMAISIVLWVAVAFQVGLQENTCDTVWQFSRDGLITSAFVLSATALMVVIVATIVAVCAFKKKRKDKYEPENQGPVFPLIDTSQNDEALEVSEFGAIKPMFQPEDPHKCQDCGAKLWPGFRHYHCYACGKLVCAPCSEDKAYLQYCRKECRVCKNCFQEYSKKQLPEEQPAQDPKLKDSSPVPENSDRVQETTLTVDTHRNPLNQGAEEPEEGKGEKVAAKERGASTDSKSDADLPSNKTASEQPDVSENPPPLTTSKEQEGHVTEMKAEIIGSDGDTQQDSVTQSSPSAEVEEQPTMVKINVCGVPKSDWEPDESCSICPVCNKTEFGWKERRHHCRMCGRVVCGACSLREAHLQNYKGKERVCDYCWNNTSLGLQHREQVQDGGPQAPEKGAQVQENDSQVQGTGPEESGPKVKEEKVAQVQDDNPQVLCPQRRSFPELTNECHKCKKDFSLPKRYQCPGCGNWVCNKCSKNKDLIEYSGKMERVCDSCHGKYLENEAFKKERLCNVCHGKNLKNESLKKETASDVGFEEHPENEALKKETASDVGPEEHPKNGALIRRKERECVTCHGKYFENVVFDKQPFFVPIGLGGAAKCLLCDKVFKPPKHVQCPACHNWYCGKCLKKQAPLQYSGKTESVCDFCYEKYQAMIVPTTTTEVASSVSQSPQVPSIDPTTENMPDSEVERGSNNKN